ncbi:MAG: histidine phosphatase family protein [Rhizobiaceae bacterium]
MPIVYFVRHGQTDWNAELRFQGQQDIAINATGREQARRNGARLAGLIAEPAAFRFVASPLGRTRQTMQVVRTELGLNPARYETDDRLVEINYGDWEGSTLEEIESRHPELVAARRKDKWNYVPPGKRAESYAMQAKRFEPWLEEVEQPTVCVTHGGILRCVLKLRGSMSGQEAGDIVVPQDRIMALDDARVEWL